MRFCSAIRLRSRAGLPWGKAPYPEDEGGYAQCLLPSGAAVAALGRCASLIERQRWPLCARFFDSQRAFLHAAEGVCKGHMRFCSAIRLKSRAGLSWGKAPYPKDEGEYVQCFLPGGAAAAALGRYTLIGPKALALCDSTLCQTLISARGAPQKYAALSGEPQVISHFALQQYTFQWPLPLKTFYSSSGCDDYRI